MKKFLLLAFIILLIVPFSLFSQITIGDQVSGIDYANPRDYEIGGVTFSGVQFIDNSILLTIADIAVGDVVKVPGDKLTKAVTKLWDQGLFENIVITATNITGNKIFLDIHLTERPRLSKFSFTGVRKGEIENLREEIKIMAGDVITDNVIIRTKNKIKTYFINKGYLNIDVDIVQKHDTTRQNNQILFINVRKNGKVKIHDINVHGNSTLTDIKVRSLMKETKERGIFKPFEFLDSLILVSPPYLLKFNFKEYGSRLETMAASKFKLRIFKSSKFIEEDYFADKLKVIEKYNALGYRDARLVKDSIRKNPDNTIGIDLYIDEGRKYYFRDISWVGNTKYSNQVLNNILKIRKGDIYNQDALDASLSYNPNGLDISSLYLDDGYLFFSVEPVEVKVENDSIDLEIRIREGKQARINKVSIKGNTKTNDHVIIREIRTRPGQLFSRADIIRTTRELAQLRYFNAEKIQPVPKPNPADGTVDLEYNVEETSSDQVELSGGWGYGRVVGTLGVSFNNFSLRNILKRSAWTPVPSGDGQKFSIRVQSYGTGYLSYNVSFTEPWLGGKKPNALSVSYFHSLYANSSVSKSNKNYYSFKISGVTVGLGKRLKWPDDYFTVYHNFTFQRYSLYNYSDILAYSTGHSNNFSYGLSLSRNSIDAPIYPRSGSEISITMQMTPPYSFFSSEDYSTLSAEKKYRWIEYHKWKFLAAFNTKLIDNFVLFSRVKYGFLGMYNSELGITPFERFYIGGDGLSGYNNLDGRELIGLRGYANESVTPGYYETKTEGGTIYGKYTLELRYPISLNPNSTIYAMTFLEAGNAWLNFKKFNPFDMKRSAGLGVRVFLPMFGILGLDWGYGFDEIPGGTGANGGQFHFSINQSID